MRAETRYALLPRTLLAALAVLALAACGAETPEPTATVPVSATPTAEADSSAQTPAGWRADVEVGPRPGDRAADAALTLADGSSVTIEEAAAGRSVILYFFATW